jgi:hypothetical protein
VQIRCYSLQRKFPQHPKIPYRGRNYWALFEISKTEGKRRQGPQIFLGNSGGHFTFGGYRFLRVAGRCGCQGRIIEHNGITPRICVELSRDALREGKDTQLERATEVGQKSVARDARDVNMTRIRRLGHWTYRTPRLHKEPP